MNINVRLNDGTARSHDGVEDSIISAGVLRVADGSVTYGYPLTSILFYTFEDEA